MFFIYFTWLLGFSQRRALFALVLSWLWLGWLGSQVTVGDEFMVCSGVTDIVIYETNKLLRSAKMEVIFRIKE